MSAWNMFVKENYHKVKHLPNKERLKALSALRVERGGALASEPKTKGKAKAKAKAKLAERAPKAKPKARGGGLTPLGLLTDSPYELMTDIVDTFRDKVRGK